MAGNERKCPRRLKMDTALCLSDLPDEILLRIISLLPTKSAFATSLLSRRWQFLWTSTPDLQLDESWFAERNQFMTFAERALLLRVGSSLVSFSFHLRCRRLEDYADYAARINTLITSAIRYNVEQFSLDLWAYGKSLVLPFCMFGCQSLVKLDLSMGFLHHSTIRVPSIVCLPRLKHLALKWVAFVDNESTEKLLSHPLLEELIISECTWGGVTAVNVNSPMLQSLTIHDRGKADWSEERQICFFGDNLKIFSYHCVLWPTQYCICGSTMQLREADISVGIPFHKFQDMDGPSNCYCKLVNQLSMVQTLTLSDHAVNSFYLLSQCQWLQTTLPVFERVTRLNLHDRGDEVINIESEELRMLYNRCPHLEHLNFKDEIMLSSLTEDTPILTPIPACFRTHLKKVTLQRYEPERMYQDPIFLLFNSAPVLEEVVIHWKRGYPVIGISGQVSTVEELERELNSRPKVSENCKVSIVLV